METHGLEVLSNGSVMFDGKFVGEMVDNRLTLNLGWCRMAGLGLTVLGDPATDKRRIVLTRPKEDKPELSLVKE